MNGALLYGMGGVISVFYKPSPIRDEGGEEIRKDFFDQTKLPQIVRHITNTLQILPDPAHYTILVFDHKR